MSRRGWSTSNYVRYGVGMVTAAPLTMAVWAKTSVTGTAQVPMGLFSSGSAYNRNSFRLEITTGNVVAAATASGGGSSQAVSSTSISADTWFHACGVFASSTSRAAYLNGAGKGTEATSRVPSSVDRISIGVGEGTTAAQPLAPAGTGDIAEAALWNVALTDAEVASLATGISPLLIRPTSLVGYWPLIGVIDPEPNLFSNASKMFIQGSLSAAAHPRVFIRG